MPRILEQYSVHCGTCGEYLWKYLSGIYDITLGEETNLNRDDFCQKCDPRKFFGCLKTADKILPLTQDQRDAKSV